METYRLFIAADLPAEVKAALLAAQERLGRDRHPVKWAAPEAMHLTLKFLGEMDVALLPDIGVEMRAALQGQAAIPLQVGTPGAFPNLRRPSVVWVGVGGAIERLADAHSRLASGMVKLGIAAEARQFRAHLTLGRVRDGATPEQYARLGAAIRALAPPEPVAWRVEEIVLFRSELRREGPVYTRILDVGL
jgi:RNA 2',3'-cyclic 3'-phosphodiesterase